MSFRDCAGHRPLLAVLARSIGRGTLPPSLLFAGAEGIGKRLVAVAVAQALNCPQAWVATPTDPAGLAVDACGACPSCQRIARGVHPDVAIVEPGSSGSIKVDHVRDVVDRSAFRPFEGKRRVVIIDDADAMVDQAQNALLKTLEEPPPASVFLLVTARPDALLPTVRSRCPLLRFRPLSPDEVATALLRAGLKEPEARAVAAIADGSVGRALHASAGDLLESRDVAARVLLQASRSDSVRARLEVAKELVTGATPGAGERDQMSRHLRAMASLLRDVELLESGGDGRALANADARAELGRLSAFGGERGVRAFAAVDEALLALDGNASAKAVADWLLLRL
jgi:DNA polymerase-3 subunit delta'